MPSLTSPAPAAAPSSAAKQQPPTRPTVAIKPTTAIKPAQCRPGTLAGELRISLLRASRRLRLERSSTDINDGQYSVLHALAFLGPMTPGALAEREHVQPPHITRTVAALAEAGLVSRGEHPTDKRQVLVTITEAGAQEVRETKRRRDAWLAQRLKDLSVAERTVLAEASEILRRIATS